METKDTSIIIIDSGMPGKTLTIFGGIHGNEKAGIMTLEYLKTNLKLLSGKVYLILANPVAAAKDVRFTEKNLNRVFIKDSTGDTYEEVRARELMKILDESDALLDLHAYREPLGESTPFLICEEMGYNLASKLGFTKVVSGFSDHEKGATDAYMTHQGKIAICAELGAIETPEKFVDLGVKTSLQFLSYFELIEEVAYDNTIQDYMTVELLYKKKSMDFKFTKQYMTFDQVTAGEVIAIEDGIELISPCDGFILFPRDSYEVGVEAFILAKTI